jgi:aspartyl-tRNA(Asn)/glutamyl-tRNA(Gln) amidotransferase subunit A
MTNLTSLTLAEARDGLAKKSFTSVELTDAYIVAVENARVLNAYVL